MGECGRLRYSGLFLYHLTMLLLPALQKFYNALKHLEQFSLESSFFDNIGALDVFLSEFRSVTLVLQKSLGSNQDPTYKKNLSKYILKDERVANWLKDQRNAVVHEHPFNLKKVVRVVIYSLGNSIEFRRFEQTIEDEKPIGDFEQMIRNTLLSIAAPEICFSAQFLFVDEEETKEINIFDLIEPGVTSMWMFLHAMKNDLAENDDVVDQLMHSIDDIYLRKPQRWMTDALDYCYYRSVDSFERGESVAVIIPDVRTSVSIFINYVKSLNAPIHDFFDAFIWLHSWLYIHQEHNLMNTFFVEYSDGTYLTISFLASLRTTMYRIIDKIVQLISNNDISNVFLVTEMVGYEPYAQKDIDKFLQLNYRERERFRTKDFLAFFKVTSLGEEYSLMIDSDDLIDRLSISAVMGRVKDKEIKAEPSVMLAPIVKSFKDKLLMR